MTTTHHKMRAGCKGDAFRKRLDGQLGRRDATIDAETFDENTCLKVGSDTPKHLSMRDRAHNNPNKAKTPSGPDSSSQGPSLDLENLV